MEPQSPPGAVIAVRRQLERLAAGRELSPVDKLVTANVLVDVDERLRAALEEIQIAVAV